jgi:hypothetical protein
MKHFFKRHHIIIRGAASERFEARRHPSLPARVHRVIDPSSRRGFFEIFRFEIDRQQSVGLQKERIVAPARFAQHSHHRRPHIRVANLALFHFFLAEFEPKADALRITRCAPAHAGRGLPKKMTALFQ